MVVGGGAAGIAAATYAAKDGANVALVDAGPNIGGELLSGLPIDGCLNQRGEWVGKNPDQLGVLERTFLTASADAKAQAEAIAAESERKTRRTRRVALAVLSFFAVGATMSSILAYLAFREARQNEMRAELATVEAHNRFAGALGAAAYGLIDADPLLALALGAEAIARAEGAPPAYESRAALAAARRALARWGPVVFGSPIAVGDALAIALNADGSLLATAQRNGNIDLIDTATGRKIGSSLRGHVGGVRDLDFGPRGRWLASAGADGTVRLWPVTDGLAGAGVTGNNPICARSATGGGSCMSSCETALAS